MDKKCYSLRFRFLIITGIAILYCPLKYIPRINTLNANITIIYLSRLIINTNKTIRIKNH